MGTDSCDVSGAAFFVAALVAGTGCTICSKALFQVRSIGMTGEEETFKPAIFQTFVMFLGMSFALPAYFIGEARKRAAAANDPDRLLELQAAAAKITARTYALLAVPSVLDLLATCLMLIGLQYVNASVWMLLRGGGIVFVALMKNYFLRDVLQPAMWLGVFLIAAAVVLVGLASKIGASEEGGAEDATRAVWGVGITMTGTLVQSCQYVYEEKVMSGDIQAPPWLLIGMEGVTGTLITIFILYPLAYWAPGDDHGSFENVFNTVAMLSNSPMTILLAIGFLVLVFILNSFSVLVTYMMSSVWHAILDNFRPISIWVTQLAIYYSGTGGGQYGEPWTDGSWLQLFAMGVLLLGTAIYNGSITLPIGDGDLALLVDASPMSTPALSRSPYITMNRAGAGDGERLRTSPYLGGGSGRRRLSPDIHEREPLSRAPDARQLGERLLVKTAHPTRRLSEGDV